MQEKKKSIPSLFPVGPTPPSTFLSSSSPSSSMAPPQPVTHAGASPTSSRGTSSCCPSARRRSPVPPQPPSRPDPYQPKPPAAGSAVSAAPPCPAPILASPTSRRRPLPKDRCRSMPKDPRRLSLDPPRPGGSGHPRRISGTPAKPRHQLPPATRQIGTSCTPCGGAASATSSVTDEHRGLEVQHVLIGGARWREVGCPRQSVPQRRGRQSWAVSGVGEGGGSGGRRR
ncbi:hypothetical protein ACQJBY_018434 [Aegilops geniculata]